jgi:hypothetical protein
MQEAFGFAPSLSEEMVRTFTHRFMEKIGVKHSPSNITDILIQLNYAAAFGGRFGPPIRNLTQTFMTLGPRIGFTWIADAMDALAMDKGGLLFKKLVEKGIISKELPFYASGEIVGRGGVLEKVSHVGGWFMKNSDDWNRAVAFVACEKRFDHALRRYKAGAFDLETFIMDKSGLWNLPDDLLKTCWEHIAVGNLEAAKEVFGAQLVKETQVDYKRGLMPIWARGTAGKVFGHFATYPVNFVANIRNGFARARTFKQKAAFVGRWVGMGATLASAAAYLGLRTEDYLPGPVTFAGGPFYKTFNDLLAAFSTGPNAEEAQRRLAGFKTKDGKPYLDVNTFIGSSMFSNVIPGSLLYRSITKGVEYANQGDLYRAFLAWTSMPIDPNRQ